MEPGSIQHSGYLTPGDEINVQGGFTVHFQKKNRRYWTLQYFGEGDLVLSGYKDEKAFKRSSTTTTKPSTLARQRKHSSAPAEIVRLMTSLKVHKFEMKTKKKVENALIVVSGSHPKFFRPDNKDELDKWHSVFMTFSSITGSVKRRARTDKLAKTQPPPSNPHDSSDLEERHGHDSAVSMSFTRSPRESSSSSSSMSSDEMNEYSPRKIFPNTIFFDPEDDDQNPSPTPSPTLRQPSGRQSSLSHRKSIFVRNNEGIYEERISCTSRDSTESGFYDTSPHRSGENDNRTDSVYDYLPPTDIDLPVLPTKQLRESRTNSSFDSTDSPIPEENENDVRVVTEQLADRLGVENSPDLQKILNDDGRIHTYVNHARTSSPALGEAGPRIPDRPPNLPPRKISLSSMPVGEMEYLQAVQGGRLRAASMPIGGMSDCANEESFPRRSQSLIPEIIKPYSDIEALKAEQTLDEVEVHIKKEDLVDSIALVDMKGKVIIAGWSKDLFGKVHIGDELVQVNDQVVSQTEWANTFIKTSSRDTIVLHVNRLPYATILNCKRIHEDTMWGIECKGNEITRVHSGPVKEAGLTEKSESSAFSKKSCDWIITEVANKPLKLNCHKDDMRPFLVTKDLDLPLVVHPKDFIHDLNKALNRLKRSSLYHVG